MIVKDKRIECRNVVLQIEFDNMPGGVSKQAGRKGVTCRHQNASIIRRCKKVWAKVVKVLISKFHQGIQSMRI